MLLSALNLKQADHKCISLRLALADAEIETAEQHLAFLSTMRDQHDGAQAVSGECLKILDQVLGARGLVDAEDNKQYYRNLLAEQRVSSTVSGTHIAQMHAVIGPRVSCWLEEDGGAGKDLFRGHSGDSYDRYSEGGLSDEGTEDKSLPPRGFPISSRQ